MIFFPCYNYGREITISVLDGPKKRFIWKKLELLKLADINKPDIKLASEVLIPIANESCDSWFKHQSENCIISAN